MYRLSLWFSLCIFICIVWFRFLYLFLLFEYVYVFIVLLNIFLIVLLVFYYIICKCESLHLLRYRYQYIHSYPLTQRHTQLYKHKQTNYECTQLPEHTSIHIRVVPCEISNHSFKHFHSVTRRQSYYFHSINPTNISLYICLALWTLVCVSVVCFSVCLSLGMCIFAYVDVKVCIHISACKYIYVHTHVHMCIYICICAYTYAYVHTHIRSQNKWNTKRKSVEIV